MKTPDWRDFTFRPWTTRRLVAYALASESTWRLPRRWNAKPWGCDGCGAAHKEQRETCFAEGCSGTSMHRARVFVDVPDWLGPLVPVTHLAQLLKLIRQTPQLVWMLSSPSPRAFERTLLNTALYLRDSKSADDRDTCQWLADWAQWKQARPNIWLGTPVQTQAEAARRVSALVQCTAVAHFVLCEPSAGVIDLTHLDADAAGDPNLTLINALNGRQTDMGRPCADVPKLAWVICGAQRGPREKAVRPSWVRSLRDQCAQHGTPFFFGGWGEWLTVPIVPDAAFTGGFAFEAPGRGRSAAALCHRHGSRRVWRRMMPGMGNHDFHVWAEDEVAVRVGHARAGRQLDGREHNAILPI